MADQGGAGSAIPIDDIDKAIIRLLQRDGRMAYAKLGPRVSLSSAAARQRVQRLVEHRVIEVVAVSATAQAPDSTSRPWSGCGSTGTCGEVASALADIEEIVYVVVRPGRFDIITEVVCRIPGSSCRSSTTRSAPCRA
ncbi:MAG: AsnC family transcriptional regulator [Schumannella sp.]